MTAALKALSLIALPVVLCIACIFGFFYGVHRHEWWGVPVSLTCFLLAWVFAAIAALLTHAATIATTKERP